ncbi:HPP family protein [Pelomonas sp. APW6]|uniref:HPP family protein n=1 Tax=Roseateles subflavus TaxID=3053353 RepID=A0ABT7LDD1_9BURK|nr:HPP family protein [Pelomonas sp. APW6]MDL5030874.1 HPP family protein [Pelomonas sp. APW6]
MSSDRRPDLSRAGASRPGLAGLRTFIPAPLTAPWRELLLGALGVGLGLLCTEWISRHALAGQALWFVAPMGASAVLVFSVPASPLAQPWSVLGGNVISALVGVACHHVLGASGPALAAAGLLAVLAMIALRCLHPPGGAVAVTAALGSPTLESLGYSYAFWPVGLNSLLMLVLALVFNRLAGRHYPHQGAAPANVHRTADPLPSRRGGLQAEDVDAALASFGEVLDIDRHDLEEILVRAQLHARQRQWADVRCADVMARDVICVGPQAPIDTAWALLARHKVKALPVVDAGRRLVGIVSLHDFFLGREPAALERGPRMTEARRVSDIMTARVRSARPEQALAELVGAFSDGGLHHMPVVDEARRVVGMITQSDVVAALFSRQPAVAANAA